MYTIEKTDYGFKLIFEGFINLEEMRRWSKEFLPQIQSYGRNFGVYVDMRRLKPLPQDAQEFLLHGQIAARDAGMERSAVILSSAIVTMQFSRLAKKSGIYEWERYIDASKNKDYEKTALNWVAKGVDPD